MLIKPPVGYAAPPKFAGGSGTESDSDDESPKTVKSSRTSGSTRRQHTFIRVSGDNNAPLIGSINQDGFTSVRTDGNNTGVIIGSLGSGRGGNTHVHVKNNRGGITVGHMDAASRVTVNNSHHSGSSSAGSTHGNDEAAEFFRDPTAFMRRKFQEATSGGQSHSSSSKSSGNNTFTFKNVNVSGTHFGLPAGQGDNDVDGLDDSSDDEPITLNHVHIGENHYSISSVGIGGRHNTDYAMGCNINDTTGKRSVGLSAGSIYNMFGFQARATSTTTTVTTPDKTIYENGKKIDGSGPDTYADYKKQNSDAPAFRGPGWQG